MSTPLPSALGPLELSFAQLTYLHLGQIETRPFGPLGGELAWRIPAVGRNVLFLDHRLRTDRLARVEIWVSDGPHEGGPVYLCVACDACRDRQSAGGPEELTRLIEELALLAPAGMTSEPRLP